MAILFAPTQGTVEMELLLEPELEPAFWSLPETCLCFRSDQYVFWELLSFLVIIISPWEQHQKVILYSLVPAAGWWWSGRESFGIWVIGATTTNQSLLMIKANLGYERSASPVDYFAQCNDHMGSFFWIWRHETCRDATTIALIHGLDCQATWWQLGINLKARMDGQSKLCKYGKLHYRSMHESCRHKQVSFDYLPGGNERITNTLFRGADRIQKKHTRSQRSLWRSCPCQIIRSKLCGQVYPSRIPSRRSHLAAASCPFLNSSTMENWFKEKHILATISRSTLFLSTRGGTGLACP